MRITYKSTIWQDLYFADTANIDEIINLIKEEDVHSVINGEFGFIESMPLHETEMLLSPEENNGESTVEIYDNSNKLIWENGK